MSLTKHGAKILIFSQSEAKKRQKYKNFVHFMNVMRQEWGFFIIFVVANVRDKAVRAPESPQRGIMGKTLFIFRNYYDEIWIPLGSSDFHRSAIVIYSDKYSISTHKERCHQTRKVQHHGLFHSFLIIFNMWSDGHCIRWIKKHSVEQQSALYDGEYQSVGFHCMNQRFWSS